MSDKNPIIVGAGLAGLIAAHAWPNAEIAETSVTGRQSHKALLRFRSQAVAQLVGVEFRKVRVHKGIWAEGSCQQPAIRWANLYAQKVLGRDSMKGDRSIWSLETVERYIAPDDLYDQLIAAVGDRIWWGHEFKFKVSQPVISTAPLPVALQKTGIAAPELKFNRSGITVRRWRIPGADVFQTVYFPDPALSVYRASITGDTLIIESVEGRPFMDEDVEAVQRAFGIGLIGCAPLETVDQKYGKIAPIDDNLRKQLLFKLTHEHGIYSLGRFATWRNILLDDVVDDINSIKRLLKTNSAYDTRKAMA